MRLGVREQLKALLSQEAMTQRELVKILSVKKGKNYTPTGFSNKLTRGSFSYNEMMVVAEILGYDVQYVKER